VENIASPQRIRRRMGGIPPLAADLISDHAEVAAVQLGRDVPLAGPSLAPAVAEPTAAETALTGPVLKDPRAATVAQMPAAGRRMAGASTVPLAEGIALAVAPDFIVREPLPAAAPIPADAAAPLGQGADGQSRAVGYPPVETSNRRRLGGPSSTPLLIARTPEPQVASAPVETVASAPAASAPDTIAERVPGAPRRRMGNAPLSGSESAQPAAAAEPPSIAASAEPQAPAATTRSVPTLAVQTPSKVLPSPAVKRAAAKATDPRKTAIRKHGIQLAVLIIVAVLAVLATQWLRTLPAVAQFIGTYSGHSSVPQGMPEGIPRWLGWQHFLNMFFMVLIVRTGLQVRLQRKPPGYWTAKQGSFFSPGKQSPKKVSMTQWLHQSLDVLWVLNGLIFIIVLLASGYWKRIVPTSWDVFPNMLSAGIQYLSLDWPDENGWIHYNALQVMAYFITVFIAAPLAIVSGLRMSTWWPAANEKLSKAYPVEVARAIHIPVMVYFLAFTVVHVFLVFFTGAMRNLNHMYTSRDTVDFWGLLIFIGSLVIVAAGWFLTNQMFMRPVAGAMGKVSKN
jgi:thiosulfate reductase cytochrome b subunit